MALVERSAFANDQWQQSGMNPLVVSHPAAGAYAHDPSQMVLPDGCARDDNPQLSQVLHHAPREAFTHVWVVGHVPSRAPGIPDLHRLPASGSGYLYAVR